MINITRRGRRLYRSFILILLSIIIASGPSAQVYAYDQEYYSTNDVLYYDPRDQCLYGQGAATASSIATSTDSTENLKTVFAYFKSKGLSDIQAAAVVGNVAQESGGNPINAQKGPDTKDPSVFGTSIGGGKAWGLIQWDGGGRAIEYAKDAGISGPIYEMGTQLDLIYWHMTDISPTSARKMLDGWTGEHIASIEAAVKYFEHKITGAGRPLLEKRYAAARTALGFSGATINTASASPSGSGCTCSVPPPASGQNTIVLDPGHSKGGVFKDTDPASGIRIGDYSNGKEDKDAWDVAQKVKEKLITSGYTVLLTKDAVDSYTNLKMRADVGNKANAALGVSIHTTGGNFNDSDTNGDKNANWATPQKLGGWRQGKKEKVTFDNQELADKSKGYADIIANERAAAIGGNAKVTTTFFGTGNFNRKDFSPGDIPITQLFAKIPWVYNEAGQSGLDTDKYAEGIANGIQKAIPIAAADAATVASADAATGTVASPGCGGIGDTGDLAATIRLYTHPDFKGNGYTTPLPPYKEATRTAVAAGLWVGNNGIDCGGYVTRLMQNSGLDKDYNNLPGLKGDTGVQRHYLEKSGKYTRINPSDTSQLQLGDIAITPVKGHTYMWVGSLQGINSKSVSASNGNRAPMADQAYYSKISTVKGEYLWFRLTSSAGGSTVQ